MLVLGATGWVSAQCSIPMPIVMGMVAGVFLRFGLDLVRALHNDIAIAGPMVVTRCSCVFPSARAPDAAR